MTADLKNATYDPRCFAELTAVEDRHFWFQSRNRLIASLLSQLTSGWPDGYRVLEPGCGNGNVLRYLETACRGGTVVGMDLFEEGLQHARRRTTCPLVRADIRHPPFERCFELIGVFDVLEHIPDDLRVLLDLHRMLTPGGVLLLTVPAHMSLWSYSDEAAHHCRRYSQRELQGKLAESGFEIEYLTESMCALFPLVWMGRHLAQRLNRAVHRKPQTAHELFRRDLKIVPVLNEILLFLLGLEGRLILQRRRIPIGTSLLAVGKRR